MGPTRILSGAKLASLVYMVCLSTVRSHRRKPHTRLLAASLGVAMSYTM